MRRAVYAAAAGACAAGAARLAYAAMDRRPPGGPKAWSRTNHRGEPVTLLEGPAVAAGAIAGVLVQGVQAAGLGLRMARNVRLAGLFGVFGMAPRLGHGPGRGRRGGLRRL